MHHHGWVLPTALAAAVILVTGCNDAQVLPPAGDADGYCTASADCPTGQFCQLGLCVAGTPPSGGDPGDDPGDGDTGNGGDTDNPGGDPTPGDPGTVYCECHGLQLCNEAGDCVEPALCVTDNDCLGERVCFYGACTEPPLCRSSADCPGGSCGRGAAGVYQCCAVGGCPECQQDSECPGAQTCINNACTNAAACTSDADCIGTHACTARCDRFDVSACSGVPATCGNGVIDSGEACDGDNFGGATCASESPGAGGGGTPIYYSGGELRCAPDCSAILTDACRPSTCGSPPSLNPETGEVCDTADLGGGSCPTGGTLMCLESCRGYDYTGCDGVGICGDGKVDPGEVCDGDDTNGQTCASLGLGSGTLACAPRACSLPASCDDPEPNNAASAQPLTLTGNYTSGTYSLCPGDVDWFSVAVEQDDTLVVRITYPERDGEVRGHLLLPNDTLPSSVDGDGLGAMFFPLENLAAGTVSFGLEELGLDFARAHRLEYQLEVFRTDLCRDDALEPNDAFHGAATVQPSDGPFTLITCDANEDWLSFEVPSNATVSVSLTTTFGVAPVLELYRDSPSNRLALDKRDIPNKVVEHTHAGGPATYWIGAYSLSGTGRSVSTLTIAITP